MTRAKDWSDQDIQTLVDMSAKGFTHREIGQAIGRSHHAVAGKASNIRQLMTVKRETPKQVITVARPMSRSEAFTSRFCGDPPPGRSALDQRASQSIPSNKRQQNG